MGIFNCDMFKDIFKNGMLKGIERGTFKKDMGNKDINIDMSSDDMESVGGVGSMKRW